MNNQPTHKFMMALTDDMPCKQINLEKQAIFADGYSHKEITSSVPYLQRYYAGSISPTHDLWFHRFLSNDSERHVHSHPFEFRTSILCGSYREELLFPDGHRTFISRFPESISINELSEYALIAANNLNIKMPLPNGRKFDLYHWHRIVEVEPNTWTMILVEKRRLKTWNFMDDDGNIKTVMGSPIDWYKQYKKRGSNQGDVE